MSQLQIADRLSRVAPSASVAVADKARTLQASGRRIISLALGEPDFDTPNRIKTVAVGALFAGDTKYTKVDGTDPLKTAIAAKLKRDNGLDYAPGEITVSSGAKQVIFNAMLATLNPGDEVVIPAPYWVSYPEMALITDGAPVIVHTRMDEGFKVTPEALASALTPRTRMLILNSPSNPTGAIYSRAELVALGEVLRGRPDVLVVSDDIYEYIRWTGEPFHNLASACPDLKGQVLVVNGVSKSHAMTGWRIGYAAGPAPVIAAMRTIQSHSTSSPNSIAQAAAVEAMAMGEDDVSEMTRAFRQRNDYVVRRLNAIPGVRCVSGAGAFYAFPDVSDLIARLRLQDDVALADRLLETASGGVAVVPGSGYGAPGFLRLSFATSMDELKAALDTLEQLAREA